MHSNKRVFTVILILFVLNLNNLLIAFDKSITIDAPYISLNCSEFSFYSWFQPFEVLNINNRLIYPGDDKHLISYNNSIFNASLSYWLDCVDNYYRCAGTFIRDFYIPYLYRCKYLYYNNSNFNLEIIYPEVLQGTTTFSCKLPEDKNRVGLFYVLTRLDNVFNKNYAYHYLDYDFFYLNILPRSPFLLDPKTELTNTQYKISDDLILNLKSNFNSFTFTSNTYSGFKLSNTSSGTLDNRLQTNVLLRSVKNLRPFYNTNENFSNGLFGSVKLDFYYIFKNVSNRFAGLEYNLNLLWEDDSGRFGVEDNKLNSQYIFVRGPNTVIYLRSIEVRK